MRFDTTPTLSVLLVLGTTLAFGWVLTLDTADAEPRFWNGPDGWSYRRTVDVTNPSVNVTLTDQQVVFSLSTSTLISAGKMRSDCGDLRVATDDGTLLPHWIESGCGAGARVWAKVPSVPGGTTRVLHLYYGNPSATSASSVNATFQANSIRFEVSSCTVMIANTCRIVNHSTADVARDRPATRCSGGALKIDWGYVCNATLPNTSTQNEFSVEYRFLLVPDVTGVWGFGVRSDNWSEFASSATDGVLVTSHIPIAEGSYGDNVGETTENLTLNAGEGRWYSYVAAEGTGAELQRLRLARPGGALQILSTTNFPGMIYRRAYPIEEPDVVVGAAEDSLPSAPLSLTSAPGPAGGEITLDWEPPATAGSSAITRYRIWVSGAELGPWTLLGNVTTTGNVVTGAAPGATYYFRIQPQTSLGGGLNASVVGSPFGLPSAPQGVAAQAQNHSVALTWSAPASNGGDPVDGFRILRQQGPMWTIVANATSGLNTSFTLHGLTNGTAYSLRVVAYNLAGDGAQSPTVSATPGARPDPPHALTAQRGNGAVTLTWTPGHNGSLPITGYHIWRGTSAGATSIVATTTNGANTSFTVNGLTNGQTSFFNVTALNAMGQSASSNPASAKPATLPAAPTLLSLTPGNGTLALAWSPGADGGEPITSYTLHEGTTAGGETPNGTFTGSGTTLARPNGATRHFRLVAHNAVGAGALSNALSGAAGTLPYPPTAFSVAPGNRSITATWSPPVDDGGRAITHYRVQWTSAGDGGGSADSTVSPYTIAGLANGSTYTVAVYAVNAFGEGNAPPALLAAPRAPRPDPPAELAAARGDRHATLTWQQGQTGGSSLTGHTVWMGTSLGAQTPLATLGPGNVSFNANGLVNGQTYFFNLTASNAEGMSASSNVVSAKPATLPATPGAFMATRGNHSATLTWTTPGDGGEPLLGFDIHRVVDGAPVLHAQTHTAGNTSFVAHGLANGAPVTFHVRARNVLGAGAATADATVTPAGAPFPPTLVDAVRGDGRVTLSWTNGAADGTPLTGTRILQGTDPASLSVVATVGSGTTGLIRNGLTNGVTYHFALAHTSGAGTSEPSNVLSAKPARAPDAPLAFAAAFGDRRVSLSWQTPADGGEPIAQYHIHAGTSPGSLTHLASIGANTSFVAHGLTNGVTYHFRVSAQNAVGTGVATSILSATPGRVPDAPLALVAEAAENAVALSWDAPPSNGGRPLLGYEVRMANGNGAPGTLASIGTNTSFVAHGLTNGVQYRFTVLARNALGSSPPSNEASATPIAAPGAPVGVTATHFLPEITIHWAAPDDDGGAVVSQYRVYAADTPGGAPWLVGTVPGGTYSLVDAAPPGTVRHYVVRALNAAGEGPASDEAMGFTPAEPLEPPIPGTYRSCVRDATTQSATCTPGASEPVVRAAAGARHTCVLLDDGRVDCYGDDGFGQSGDHLAGQPARAVAAGGAHTCALLDDGNVDCWGDNGFGRAASYLGGDAIAVAAGGAHTCFVKVDGSASCQGANGYGQSASRNSDVLAVAAGGHHTCFLLAGGDVACQGLNDRGQSAGDTTGDAVAVSAGGFHACALAADATVRCWGSLSQGVPPAVQGRAVEIASGAEHACARLLAGNVLCWGATRDGQSDGYAGGDAVVLVAGGSHACVVTSAGALSCWGAEGPSNHGQATAYPSSAPVPTPPAPLPTTVAVDARRKEA